MTRTAPIAAAALLAISMGLGTSARAQPAGPNASFNLVNKSSQVVKELFATPAGFDNWGKNRLDGKTVAAGGSYAVRLPANGNCRYDIRVVTTDGRAEDRRGVDTCKTDDVIFSGATSAAPSASPTPPPGRTASIRLINNGAAPIAEFYARRPGVAEWGANRLVSGDSKATVAPAATLAVAVPLDGTCLFDLRVVFANQQSREKRGADLCKIAELPVK